MVNSEYDTPININLEKTELIMLKGETYKMTPSITCEHCTVKQVNSRMID
ncbi:MAG: hypothetical protein J6T10_12320 [Methanobrevibacter sp.]|nr:hypothetical protein [Methanobrevibacter sp.]